VENMLKNAIYPKYITEEPIVTTRFINYKISILGEVNRPGLYTFLTDKVNLFEALAMAGDLTIYGKRDNVLLKRENADGVNEYIRLNLQDGNLVLSPYFYLQQNDVLYVEPNKARGNGSSIGTAESMSISVVSVLISVATLLITVFK
jgi:polysaccharide export outer membrane protein